MMTDRQTILRDRSMAQWLKNKSATYECPDCGRMINKATVYRHNKSIYHMYAVLNQANKKETT
jgi:predicted RNA-binding Zn-ribbon protein involved in translation (DUF1610 family)